MGFGGEEMWSGSSHWAEVREDENEATYKVSKYTPHPHSLSVISCHKRLRIVPRWPLIQKS